MKPHHKKIKIRKHAQKDLLPGIRPRIFHCLICIFLVLFTVCLSSPGNAETEKLDKKDEQALYNIFKQLRPTPWPDSDIGNMESEFDLDVATIPKEDLTALLEWLGQYKPLQTVQGMTTPGLVVRTLAENKDWQVMEISHRKPWESWGLFIAISKQTGAGTFFYNIPPGDDDILLYAGDSFSLEGSRFSGKLCTQCEGGPGVWKNFEISLDEFIIRPAHPYRFEDFPVDSIYKGPVAKLQTSSHETARTFPTRIREQLAEGVNFSGHYAITTAGCGTECQLNIITDVKTGRVIDAMSTRAGALFYTDSCLLILEAEPYCITTDICDPEYYKMENGKLIRLD